MNGSDVVVGALAALLAISGRARNIRAWAEAVLAIINHRG